MEHMTFEQFFTEWMANQVYTKSFQDLTEEQQNKILDSVNNMKSDKPPGISEKEWDDFIKKGVTTDGIS